MLYYRHPQAKKYISPVITILVVVTVSIVWLGYSEIQKLPNHYAILLFGAALLIGLIATSSVKESYIAKGSLESDSGSRPPTSNTISNESIEIEGDDDTVFDSLEKELVGLSVEPMPLARSVWHLVSSNRALGLITYGLRISDPVKKGTYVRNLYLDLAVSSIGESKVRVDQRYRLSSPMMQKMAKKVIPQTELLLKEILTKGAIEVKMDCSSTGLQNRKSDDLIDRFELDYLERGSESQFEPTTNSASINLEEIDFERITQVQEKNSSVNSFEVKEFELVPSRIDCKVDQNIEVVEPSQLDESKTTSGLSGSMESINQPIEHSIPVKKEHAASEPIEFDDSNNKLLDSCNLEELGQISYSNFDEYADTILES